MKKIGIFTAIVVSALFISSCGDWVPGEGYKSFGYELQGTWVTINLNYPYEGKLIIGYNTIEIQDYKKDYLWLSSGSLVSIRPFKDVSRDWPLEGYSEKLEGEPERGEIFIVGGGATSIPYKCYEEGTYPNKRKILEFTFDGMIERLQLQSNY
jgi:hypothetical protein